MLESVKEVLRGVDPNSFLQILSQTAQSEITRMGFFFLLAAWIHSGRVKSEIAANFLALTEAINNVAKSLRDDLAAQSKVLANHGERLETLEKKTTSTGG